MNRPFCICHMLVSVDGKISGDYMKSSACAPALAEYAKIRETYDCDATAYGTTTVLGSYCDGPVTNLPAADMEYPKQDFLPDGLTGPYTVAIDPEGVCAWSSNTISRKGREPSRVIEVLTEDASNDYMAYLRDLDIPYIFAGKDALDCQLLAQKLANKLDIGALLLAGGGIINWSFLQAGLVDEISVVIAPIAAGGNGPTIFESSAFCPAGNPIDLVPVSAEKLDKGTMWLAYRLRDVMQPLE